ncbi:MAG: hypothetical protein IT337_09285 [Thermomicrobiales bacterium]|nr:hypothetical protein [Thermomicrobiales bacterium]
MSDPIVTAILATADRIAADGRTHRQQLVALRTAYVESDAVWQERLGALERLIAEDEAAEREARRAAWERRASERMGRAAA